MSNLEINKNRREGPPAGAAWTASEKSFGKELWRAGRVGAMVGGTLGLAVGVVYPDLFNSIGIGLTGSVVEELVAGIAVGWVLGFVFKFIAALNSVIVDASSQAVKTPQFALTNKEVEHTAKFLEEHGLAM